MNSKYIRGKDRMMQYFIPELNKWVNVRSFSKVLRRIGMTPEEYYFKYIDSKQHHCCICGKLLHPISPAKGYQCTCGSKICKNKLSSEHAKSGVQGWKHMHDNPDKYISYYEYMHSNDNISHLNKLADEDNYKRFAKISRNTQFTTWNGKFSSIYFYIIQSNNLIKIGVSTKSARTRFFEINSGLLIESVRLYKGELSTILDLEYNCKIKCYNHRADKLGRLNTELFSIDCIDIINEEINKLISSTTITEVSTSEA